MNCTTPLWCVLLLLLTTDRHHTSIHKLLFPFPHSHILFLHACISCKYVRLFQKSQKVQTSKPKRISVTVLAGQVKIEREPEKERRLQEFSLLFFFQTEATGYSKKLLITPISFLTRQYQQRDTPASQQAGIARSATCFDMCQSVSRV